MVGARLTNLRAQTLEDLSGKPSNQPIQTMDEPTTQCLCQWQRLGQRHVSVIRIAEENAKELGLEVTLSSAMFQGREILANLAWLYMIIAHAPATIDRCIAIPNRRPPRDWHDVEMSGYLDFQEANDTRILMSLNLLSQSDREHEEGMFAVQIEVPKEKAFSINALIPRFIAAIPTGGFHYDYDQKLVLP